MNFDNEDGKMYFISSKHMICQMEKELKEIPIRDIEEAIKKKK